VENCESAVEAAIEAGFAIECDVRLSADNQVVVFHDDTLGRLTDNTAIVRDLSVAELKQVRFNDGSDRIQTLQELLALAKDTAVHATSLYEFTSLINDYFDEQEKFQVIKAMWQVAFADGRIDRYEEHIIRRAADLLYVEHHRFIEAKLSVQDA